MDEKIIADLLKDLCKDLGKNKVFKIATCIIGVKGIYELCKMTLNIADEEDNNDEDL